MEIKDQLRIQMDKLGIPVSELARRLGVSHQSIRYWLIGRSFPGKAKTQLLESALSFKLDYSEGEVPSGPTVEASLRQTDIETFIEFQNLPPELKVLISQLTKGINQLAGKTPAPPERVHIAEVVDSYGYAIKKPGRPSASSLG